MKTRVGDTHLFLRKKTFLKKIQQKLELACYNFFSVHNPIYLCLAHSLRTVSRLN